MIGCPHSCQCRSMRDSIVCLPPHCSSLQCIATACTLPPRMTQSESLTVLRR